MRISDWSSDVCSSDLWNHKLKWRGESVTRYNNQMIVQQNGDYQLTKIIEDVSFPYASIKDPHAITSGNGEYLEYLSHVVAPPRLAGTYILVHDKTGTGADGRSAWLKSEGRRGGIAGDRKCRPRRVSDT